MGMKKNKIFCIVMIVIAVMFLGVFSFFTAKGCSDLGKTYADLKDKELTAETRSVIFFDDSMYAIIAFGNTDPDMQMTDYLKSSLINIDERIVSACLLYAAVFSALLVYPVYFFASGKKKNILRSVITAIGSFLMFVLIEFILMAINKVPFYIPQNNGLVLILVGLLSLIGGFCALSTLIRVIKFKKIASVIVVTLVFCACLGALIIESGLYCEKYMYSYNYLAEIEPMLLEDGYTGDFHIDPESKIAHLNGQEYSPEVFDNDDYFKGTSRVAAIGAELVNPYSGVILDMIIRDEGTKLPLGYAVLYIAKSLAWIVVPLAVNRKKELREDVSK